PSDRTPVYLHRGPPPARAQPDAGSPHRRRSRLPRQSRSAETAAWKHSTPGAGAEVPTDSTQSAREGQILQTLYLYTATSDRGQYQTTGQTQQTHDHQ